jgi:hypothetical protein
VGAAAGGCNDSDRASRHDREPVGFVDTLKIVSAEKRSTFHKLRPLLLPRKQPAGVALKGRLALFPHNHGRCRLIILMSTRRAGGSHETDCCHFGNRHHAGVR